MAVVRDNLNAGANSIWIHNSGHNCVYRCKMPMAGRWKLLPIGDVGAKGLAGFANDEFGGKNDMTWLDWAAAGKALEE